MKLVRVTFLCASAITLFASISSVHAVETTNRLTANHLVANRLTANHLVANRLTANHLVANRLTANGLAAESVTGAAVSADEYSLRTALRKLGSAPLASP